MVHNSHSLRLVRTWSRIAALAFALVIAGAASQLTPSGHAAAAGLVAAYSFDEGSGTSVADASGNGNVGTTANTSWTAGHSGSALSFNGTNARVNVPDAPELDLTAAMTLEAWVKPTAENGLWRTALIKEAGTDLAYGLYGSTDTGPPSANIVVPGVAPLNSFVRGTSTPPLSAWTHVAATYDGTTLRVYVNGVLQSSKAVGGAMAGSNGPLSIGGNTIWGEWFAGAIDDVRVYNRALTAAQVQTDMGTPVSASPPAPSGLVAAYAFDAGTGTTAADASGNGNTGTLANAAWTTAGHSGAALGFNGTNARVNVPDAPELDLTNAMTLEAWVKPTTTGGVWRSAVVKEAGSDLSYGIYGASDTGPPSANIVVAGVAPIDSYVRGTSAPPIGAWSHVAATYDGSTLRIYLNGALQASKTVGGALATSNGPLSIGGNNVWGEWFAGTIDDVRIYNRALTAAQIQTDLSTAVGGGSAPPPPPPPPSGDTQAPTAPTGLSVTGKTASTVSLGWTASSDNVGVTGYNTYNGGFEGSTAGTSFTVQGLQCGTAYTLGVEAFDAAGNKSARVTIATSTSACPTSSAQSFVSPTGNDANPCTQAAPCKSFDRAYRDAGPGDTVQMAGGTYPGQSIGVDASKVGASADVTFVPAAGATVTINGDLDVYGSHVYFKGGKNPSTIRLHNLGVQGTAGSNTAQYDTFENLDGAAFEIGPTHHITIKGGDWGPNYVCGGGGTAEDKIGPDGAIMNQWPHDIVLDGLVIHDQNSQDLNNCHMGGLFLVSGGPITIRNSVFQQNVVYQIQIQDFTTSSCCGMNFGPIHDLTIENNWFGPPVTGLSDPGGDRANDNQDELQFDTRQSGACWKNILLRYNSFHNGPNLSFDNPSCFQNVRVVGNVGGRPNCWSGVTWAYNAWVGGTCGSTDVSLPSLPYMSTTIGSEDYHLTGGAAVDLVTATAADYGLALDMDGQARPRGAARDAGADER